MGEWGAAPRRGRKERFAAKPRRKKGRLFGAPAKKTSQDKKFGRADKKAARDARTFGKADASNRRGSGDWGKMAVEAREEEKKARRGFGFGFLRGFVKRQRRAAELGRYWTVRDSLEDSIRRRQVAIEARFKTMGDEVGQLVNAVTGKPLSGNQKVQIANYIERKKSEVQQAGGLVETLVQLAGSLFGRFKVGG